MRPTIDTLIGAGSKSFRALLTSGRCAVCGEDLLVGDQGQRVCPNDHCQGTPEARPCPPERLWGFRGRVGDEMRARGKSLPVWPVRPYWQGIPQPYRGPLGGGTPETPFRGGRDQDCSRRVLA
jgi:hypothetical protein